LARFTGNASNQAPLIIQVKSNSSGAGSYGVCFAISVEGQSATGSASRPCLYRPSTPGSGTAQTPQVRGRQAGSVSSCSLITSFTSSPSLPSVSLGAFNLPIKVSWMVDPTEGFVFMFGEAIALYQNASGGQLINGALSWEEL